MTSSFAADEANLDHWAFQPVTRPALPVSPKFSGALINPIDLFVQAPLRQLGLQRAPEADRRTLIRRAYFDLAGIPPSPDAVAAFVADTRPDAYERLVDSLLASPRFGERWARHWLDVVRFAETHGFEMNNPRPNAWPYRDYVIRAFNDDRPYNQFLTEQLAGDTLGVDEATGFLVAGPWDQVKSPDEVLTKNQRADELHDMVSTVGSAMLGLTLGCARCHDHKFDPIPQADYYALKAVFEGVQHGDRERRGPDTPRWDREAAAAKLRLDAIEAELLTYEPLVQTGSIDTNLLRNPVHPRHNVERFAPVQAKRLRFTITGTSGSEPCIDELEVFSAGEGSTNVALAKWGTTASASGTYVGNDSHKLEHINDGRYGNGRSWISNESGKGWVQLDFPRVVKIDRITWARDREGKYNDRLATNYRIEVSNDGEEWWPVAGSGDRRSFQAEAPYKPEYRAAPGDSRGAERIAGLLAEQTRLEKRSEELSARPVAYAGSFRQPEPTVRFYRGDPMQPREKVQPGGLTQIGRSLASVTLSIESSEKERRVALARWIANPQNPLTARVIVNRIWQHHFSEGLVATPSDFGVNGAAPSNPALLDWLASELVGSGWSLKHIHRLILTSATYRQSSQAHDRAAATEHDPANHLLSHYPAMRLEAEPLRDGILAVCGRLDLRMGGPGWSPFEPNENYVRVYTPKQTFGAADLRRMVYSTVVRQRPDGVFGVFDCPDGGQTAPKRNRSTTPLQALNLLNSGFTMQAAEMFAERLEADAPANAASQVREAFALALQRAPTPDETEGSVRFIQEQGLTQFCRALLNSNEFVYVF